MRPAIVCLLTACSLWAQFKSTTPLVVAPASVRDAKGHYVDGLAAEDLILFDNNVRVPIQVDYQIYPISLVVAVQSSTNSQAILDKLGGSGILFTQLLAGDAGETAVLSFNDEVHLRQDFTSNPDSLILAFQRIPCAGDDAVALDAMTRALLMLSRRKPDRRRIIFMIAEKRDRSSKASLTDVVREVQRQNVAVYWLTYSPLLSAYTNRHVKTYKDVEDPKKVGIDKKHDETIIPDTGAPMNIVAGLLELAHLAKPNVADLLSQATGGDTKGVLTRAALEESIHQIGEEVHRQYIVTFQPRPGEPGQFHALRLEIRNRPDLQAKTRAGYWSIE
jgi:VWFA-related protein